jgi:hypothetical protein
MNLNSLAKRITLNFLLPFSKTGPLEILNDSRISTRTEDHTKVTQINPSKILTIVLQLGVFEVVLIIVLATLKIKSTKVPHLPKTQVYLHHLNCLNSWRILLRIDLTPMFSKIFRIKMRQKCPPLALTTIS